MASKTVLVAQREFAENVRTKTFWLGILSVPVLIVLSIGAGWVLNKLKEVKSYAVVDYSEPAIGRRIEIDARQDLLRAVHATQKQLGKAIGELPEQGQLPADEVAEKLLESVFDMPAAELEKIEADSTGAAAAKKFRFVRLSELELDHLEPAGQEQALNKLVAEDKLFAFFTIGPDPRQSLDGFRYVSQNQTDDELRRWYAAAATRVVQSIRIADAKIPRGIAEHIKQPVAFTETHIDKATGEQTTTTVGDRANKYAPVAFVYLLWIAVFSIAQMLLTNTVEEKSMRLMEVLLSSVSPRELMSGKIWGIAVTGLTMVGTWVGFALLGVWLTPMIIEGFDLPLMKIIGDPRYLISFVAYFLFGYLLYAAMLVAIGSVCNTLKESQNLMQPVIIILIVPLIAMMFIVQEPNGLVAKVLSYIPLYTPFVMMNRAGGPPENYEYVITGIILLVSVWVAFRAAGKIFRIGVLMTGKPPRFKEILGWLRAR
jgi:ABC-2 type transport system permease protein